MKKTGNQSTVVAVLGCGVIGLSWVETFLRAGFKVNVWDPQVDLAKTLANLQQQYPDNPPYLCTSARAAVTSAAFIQESGPESLTLKQKLYADIAPAMDNRGVLASSTSTLQPSQLQEGSTFADRILVGHPFNPPHILPLVEVVGGPLTATESLHRAMEFYRELGKQPIQLHCERTGHLANRLQAAVWREAIDAVACGQCSAADVDLAMTASLGPRWAVMGPFQTFHLGGGDGGLAHFFDHLGDAFEGLWDDAHRPEVTETLKQQLIHAMIERNQNQSTAGLIERRDQSLQAILAARAKHA